MNNLQKLVVLFECQCLQARIKTIGNNDMTSYIQRVPDEF